MTKILILILESAEMNKIADILIENIYSLKRIFFILLKLS